MNRSSVKYVKSFSKGQITIPKEFRDIFGLGNEFWLKLYIDKNKLIAEPVEVEQPQSGDYLKEILKIEGDWFSVKEWQGNRKAAEQRMKKHGL